MPSHSYTDERIGIATGVWHRGIDAAGSTGATSDGLEVGAEAAKFVYQKVGPHLQGGLAGDPGAVLFAGVATAGNFWTPTSNLSGTKIKYDGLLDICRTILFFEAFVGQSQFLITCLDGWGKRSEILIGFDASGIPLNFYEVTFPMSRIIRVDCLIGTGGAFTVRLGSFYGLKWPTLWSGIPRQVAIGSNILTDASAGFVYPGSALGWNPDPAFGGFGPIYGDGYGFQGLWTPVSPQYLDTTNLWYLASRVDSVDLSDPGT